MYRVQRLYRGVTRRWLQHRDATGGSLVRACFSLASTIIEQLRQKKLTDSTSSHLSFSYFSPLFFYALFVVRSLAEMCTARIRSLIVVESANKRNHHGNHGTVLFRLEWMQTDIP